MGIEKKLLLVRKYLGKKKEKIVIELIIKNYNQTNFYLALIFNSKIEKFKVLFIPLDIMDSNVNDYACYQFINISMVNYILDIISNSKDLYISDKSRDKTNKNIDSYYVEINTHVGGEDYKFKTTQYIPKEWMFMYEVIVLLFEHAPNIVSELSMELLAVLNNSAERIEYKASFVFDLFNGDFDTLFTESSIVDGGKIYEDGEVEFLEFVNGKYFAIVRGHIVIIEYNENKTILNLYCDCSCCVCGSHIYAALKAIVNDEKYDFFKIVVAENSNDFVENSGSFKYYLCYGLTNDCFRVIHGTEERLLPLSMVYDGLIKICYDPDLMLEKKVRKQLNEIYKPDEVNKIMSNIRGKFPN